jgi:hypothetical protein
MWGIRLAVTLPEPCLDRGGRDVAGGRRTDDGRTAAGAGGRPRETAPGVRVVALADTASSGGAGP